MAESGTPRTKPLVRAGRSITGSFVSAERAPLVQVLKTGVASLLAWFSCLLIFSESLPIFGTIAAIICVQDSVSQSVVKSIERFVGVVVGVSVALAAGFFFGTPSWLFIGAIFVSLLVGWAARMTAPSTNQIAISALLVIALGGLQAGYGFERIIETALGGVIGVLVNAFLVAPVRTSPASSAVYQLVENTALALERIAAALTKPQTSEELQNLLFEARELREDRREVHALLRSARDSLKLNPRSRKYTEQLHVDDELFQRLQHIITQVLGMSRALTDSYVDGLTEDPQIAGLAEEFRRAAHDLRHIGYHFDLESDVVVEPPALTSPYRIVTPNAEHWMLIGALMEDLRRTRISIKELQEGIPEG